MAPKELNKEEKLEFMSMIIKDILERYSGMEIPNRDISITKEFESVGIGKNTLIPTIAFKYLKDNGFIDERYSNKGMVLSFSKIDSPDYRNMADEIMNIISLRRKEYNLNKFKKNKKYKQKAINKNTTIKIENNDKEPPLTTPQRAFVSRASQEKFFIGEMCFFIYEGNIREGRISRIEASGKNFEFIRYGIKLSSDTNAVNVDTNIYHTLEDLARSMVKDIVKYK